MKRHWNRDWDVYANHSDFYLFNEISCRCAIRGEYRGSVSVFMVIYQLDRFPNIVDTHDAKDRTKDLFPVNPHFGPDVVKQTAAEKVSLTAFRDRSVAAIHNKTGSLFR